MLVCVDLRTKPSNHSPTGVAARRLFRPRPGSDPGHARKGLDASDIRHDSSVLVEMRVPVLVEGVELCELMAPLLEPDRLGELGCDAVLVPGDVPGDRDHDLAADAGQ